MASSILSSTSYLTYLNDYVHILLKCTDQSLIARLNENYMNEIQNQLHLILIQWYNEQHIDKSFAVFIENIGYLYRRIAFLNQRCNLNEKQLERIENILCNSKINQLMISIIESLLESNQRHQDPFLRYLSILIDSFSIMKSSKTMFNEITQRVLKSDFYKQYLMEILSSEIQPIHLIFIGAMNQLAFPIENSTLNGLYSQILIKFYKQKSISMNLDLHYCTLGILSQLDIFYLTKDYSCVSVLQSLFIKIAFKQTDETLKSFLLPLLTLFNSLCIQSKTIACYLNTDEFVDILLSYVTNRKNSQIHLYSCLLLGHIISENQLIQYRISYKLTMKLLELLVSEKKQIENILSSLLSLTIHEQIQFLIAQTYQLRNFIQLTEQYSIVYEIMWKLSFHSDIIEQLIERHEDFLKHLSTLTDLPAAQGILENIQRKQTPHLPNTNPITFDYTLVSSLKDHDFVQTFESNLQKHHLHPGTIDNSRYVILCISEDSKHDCTCQTLVRQTLVDCKKLLLCIVQKPYRIDDWFNLLDLQERKLFNLVETGMQKVLIEIQKECHPLPVIVKRTRIVTPTFERNSQTTFTLSPSPQLLSVEVLPKVPAKRIQNWTNREVLKWVDNNHLNGFNKILTLYDGRSLLALAHISRMNAPHTIINHLRNDCRKQGLRITFVEFVRFQAALDELLRLEQTLRRRQSVSTLVSRYAFKSKIKQKT
ncbi:hypothetical protein I4U23_008357 [Adineta vaga]|nr:hypothetical protein I4U23_008357 [Adineta vaga]